MGVYALQEYPDLPIFPSHQFLRIAVIYQTYTPRINQALLTDRRSPVVLSPAFYEGALKKGRRAPSACTFFSDNI